ncbi:MAG TPA: hypothetical protein DDW65_19405 [Firmicutes bacterium]|jgi:hypothetical protein|nr:hypothetical protein [Bacillota bacterium]
MRRKLLVMLLISSLMLFTGMKTFAAGAANLDLGANSNISTEGFSGTIDTYNPDSLGTYQADSQNLYSLDLEDHYGHGPGHGGPRHQREHGPDYRPLDPMVALLTVVLLVALVQVSDDSSHH